MAPRKIEFLQFFIRAIQSVRPEFAGPPMDPPPLPLQLQDPERLRRELTAAGLKDVRVETIIETLEFESGDQIWNWVTNSNPITGTILAGLGVTEDETGVIRAALDGLVAERAGGGGRAILTNPINIGLGTK